MCLQESIIYHDQVSGGDSESELYFGRKSKFNEIFHPIVKVFLVLFRKIYAEKAENRKKFQNCYNDIINYLSPDIKCV